MILLTVGSFLAFDRLVEYVDRWAADRQFTDILAQIGPRARKPHALEWVSTLAPDEYSRAVAKAQLLVSHAGMGTVLTALEAGKALVVLPRREALRETTTDHQFATAQWLERRGLCHVAYDEDQLRSLLDRGASLEPGPAIPPAASPELISALREFVEGV